MKKKLFSAAVLMTMVITAAAANRWPETSTAAKFPSWPNTESVAKFPAAKFPVAKFPS